MDGENNDPVTNIVESVPAMPTNDSASEGTVVAHDGTVVTLGEE